MDIYYLKQNFQDSNNKLLDFFTEVHDKLANLEYDNQQLKDQVRSLTDKHNWLQSQIDEIKNPPKPTLPPEYFIGVDPYIDTEIIAPAEGHVYKIH